MDQIIRATQLRLISSGQGEENAVREAISENIESLKSQLREKDDEIHSLRKKVRDLEGKNDELEIKLGTKDSEIKSLKERIGKLETEKKTLENELDTVRSKLGRVESEVEDLKRARNIQEDTNVELSETIAKINKQLTAVTTDLQTSSEENRSLKREVKDLREAQKSLRQTPSLLDAMGGMLPGLQQLSHPKLLLGEMCGQIQAKMYKVVLPGQFTSLRSYKIKAIERDLEKLLKSKQEKDDATRRYNNLKESLKWDEKYVDVMKSLQDSRNTEAHPTLTEGNLLKSLKALEETGELKGWLSPEAIKELIEMWKALQNLPSN